MRLCNVLRKATGLVQSLPESSCLGSEMVLSQDSLCETTIRSILLRNTDKDESYKLLFVHARRTKCVCCWEEFERAVTEILKSVIRKRCRPNQVDDCLQESWQAIVTSMKRFDDSKQILPWIKTICDHKAISFFRQGVRSIERSETDLHENWHLDRHLSASAANSEVFEADESDDKIKRALELVQSMPQIVQAIINLKLRDEMTYAQIGQVVGLTSEATRKRFERAIIDLRKHFDLND